MLAPLGARGALGFMLFITLSITQAQDLEQITKDEILKVNGGLSVNTTAYMASGIENRRDPFYWLINANLTFDILGLIQAPFSMNISQQNKNFSQAQPFNRFGISPKYKWLTLHLGHRSLRFSDYTLAGNLFFGAGAEIAKPESFVRVSAIWGRFAKPVNKTAQSGLVFARPIFKRTGFGFKVGLGKDKNQVDLIMFTAKDDPNSIVMTDTLEVTPEENVVLGLTTRNAISDRLTFEGEYTYSLFTRDTRSPEITLQKYSFVNNSRRGFLLQIPLLSSSEHFMAISLILRIAISSVLIIKESIRDSGPWDLLS